MEQKTTKDLTLMFQALGDTTRWNILRFLAATKDGMTQTSLSQVLNIKDNLIGHHCSKLAYAGVINRNPSGRYVIYTVNPEAIALLELAVHTLLPKEEPKDANRSNG